jgi:hypothetical protein
MAKASEIRLEVGACGWEHAGWLDGFYPDSLPDDWRLTYYSNEFRCALIPPDYWQRFGPEAPARWIEDVHADFRFYPELLLSATGAAPAPADLRRWCEPLASRVGGMVVRLDPDAPPAADVLAELLGQLTGPRLAAVDCPAPLVDGYRDAVGRAEVAWCWRPAAADALHGCRIGRLAASEAGADLRRLRAMVERFIEQAAPGEDLTLLFEGEPPSISRMNDVAVILSLLS